MNSRKMYKPATLRDMIPYLQNVKQRGAETVAACPVCEAGCSDGHHLYVRESGGKLLAYCQKCNAKLPEILKALDIKPEFVKKETSVKNEKPAKEEKPFIEKMKKTKTKPELNKNAKPEIMEEYDHVYKNPDGTAAYYKHRVKYADGSKVFRFRYVDEHGKTIFKKPERCNNLYNLDLLERADADTCLYIVEGEKCADAMVQHGFLATTGNTGVVTGGKVYEALQSQSAAIDGKANTSLDNITDSGKTVVRDLAKEAVKVVDGTNTTVTEGTDGNAKTYAVNVVTSGAVVSGDTGIVTGGTVFTETRVSADGNYVKASNSAADNVAALDTQVKKNEDAIGTTADGNYVKASNSVGENLGALDAEIAALAGGAGAGLDEVNHRIDNMDSKINKVGAGAAALAALHPLDTDGKFSAAAGFGNYRDANAMALGLFYRPNDQVMFSMGGSLGNGENLLNVGVSFALDKGVSTSKAAMAKQINHLSAENQSIKAENAEMKEKLDAQGSEIAALKEALARLEAKMGK